MAGETPQMGAGSPKSKPIVRGVGILDGMILMIGVAIGALFTRLYLVNNYDSFFGRLEDVPTRTDYVRWIMGEAADFSCLWLTALTPVAFFIRLRRPRPTLHRMLVQPGATSLFAVMVVVALGSMLSAVAVAIEGPGPWSFFYQYYLIRLFPYAGAAVAVVWSLQIIGGRWKSEAGAIDRLGRLLGACWIAAFLSGTLAMLQQGAWSSQQVGNNPFDSETLAEDLSAQRDERLTRRKKFYEDQLRVADQRQTELKKLIEAGDIELFRAELRKQVQSLDESKQIAQEDLDVLEKEASTPPAPNGAARSPVALPQ